MPKKSKVVSEAKMKPMLYVYSNEVEIPEWIKGKLGKIVTLTTKAKLVSHQSTERTGEKKRESYDFEIQEINFPSLLEKVLRTK